MQESRVGLRLASLGQPLRKALHTAAEVGARGVELDARSEVRPAEMSRTAIRQFLKLLDDLHLTACGVAFPTRRGFSELEDLDRRVQATQAAMQLAYDLRAREVILSVGRIPPEGEAALGVLVDVLSRLAGHSDRVGARLAILTERENATEIPRLLSLLPQGAVGIAVHPAMLIHVKQAPSKWIEPLGGSVSYVYASDAARGMAGEAPRESELGRGSADVPALLGVLEGFDYKGWMTIDRRESALSSEQAADAVEFLRSL